jgi:hypothetical protein
VRWVAAIIAIVYLASIADYWVPGPDSEIYLLLGRSLATGDGYTIWGAPHVHVPPGWPLFLAGMTGIGLGEFVWLNASLIAMALATFWFSYQSLKQITSETWALGILVLVAGCHCMSENSTYLRTEIPFMLIVWAGIWCYFRGQRRGGWWPEAGTICLLASCAIRAAGVPLVPLAACGLLFDRGVLTRRRAWLHAGLSASAVLLIAAAGVAYYLSIEQRGDLPSYAHMLRRFVAHGTWAALMRPATYLWRSGDELVRMYSGQELPDAVALFVVWLPVAGGMWSFWRQGRRFPVIVCGGYLLSLLALRGLLARYFLPMAPLLFLFLIEGVRYAVDRGLRWRVHGRRAAVALGILLLAINLPRTLRNVYWTRQPTASKYYLTWRDMQHAADYLRRHANQDERFLAVPDRGTIGIYSGVPSVPWGSFSTKAWTRYLRRTPKLLEQHVRYLVAADKSPRTLKRIRRAFAPHSVEIVSENPTYRILRIGEPQSDFGTNSSPQQAQRQDSTTPPR